jgi:replicative DNA helicase
MPAAALYERIIANIMGISTQEVEQLAKSNDPYSMYSQVKEKVQKYIVVIDKNNLSVKDIDQYVQIANARIWENGRTDVVIIDYLQYMAGTNNFEELSATAKGLKPLAKDNNMIVVCLSQLNRSGSAWEKPSMKLLKGSGDIESTGDIILLAWRPSEDPALTALEKQKLEGTIMLTIGKARRGVLGATDFELFFHKEQTRIREKSPIAA